MDTCQFADREASRAVLVWKESLIRLAPCSEESVQFLGGTSMSQCEPSLICRSSPPYIVLWANDEWTSLTGYTQSEIIGEIVALEPWTRT